jgi:CHASE3 domain sensor protein
VRDPRGEGIRNGPTLREYVEGLFEAHKEAHKDHELSHAREHQFAQKAIDTAAELAKENKADANEWRATMNDKDNRFALKLDIERLLQQGLDRHKAVVERLDDLEDAEIKRVENERLRLVQEANDREAERERRRRELVIAGLVITVLAVMINLLIRLLGPAVPTQ